MPQITPIRCIVSNGEDKLNILAKVNVTSNGLFTTTLDESDVRRIKEYGLAMRQNRLGREGYFESSTYEGLKNEITAFLKECISRETVEEKEVIKYSIATNCHYVQSDKEDGYAIYPNGRWLPKRLQNPNNYCERWEEGTEGTPLVDQKYKISLFVAIYKKVVYRYASGKTVTEYEGPIYENNGESNLDYIKSTVHMGLDDRGFGTNRKEVLNLPEIEATEDNARVFVQIIQLICMSNRILKQLTNPENIKLYIKQNFRLELPE